jgi:hypothetical protein
MRDEKAAVHGAIPILLVADFEKSLRYFQERLGFEVEWIAEDEMAGIAREKCHFMITTSRQGKGEAWIWIGVEDVDVLFTEFKERGATIRQTPTNFSWAYEMQVEDLDRNVFRFGAGPKREMPFGPWFDMNGVYWEWLPDGSWRRRD